MRPLPHLKLSPLASLSLIVGMVFAILWVTHPHAWEWLSTLLCIAIVYVGWSSRYSRPDLPAQGTAYDHRNYFLLFGITLAGVLLLGLISWEFEFLDGRVLRPYVSIGTAEFFECWALKLLTYGGCLLQEAILWWIVFPLCAAVTKSWRGTVLLASSLFALLHVPNPLVALASFILGLLSFFAFRRGVSIFAMAACHLILSMAFKLSFPDYLHLRLIVGAKAVPKLEKLQLIRREDLVKRTALYWSQDYYHDNGGTDAGYIRALYRDIMKRPVSDEAVDTWIDYGRNRRLLDIALTFVHEHIVIERREGPGRATEFVYGNPNSRRSD